MFIAFIHSASQSLKTIKPKHSSHKQVSVCGYSMTVLPCLACQLLRSCHTPSINLLTMFLGSLRPPKQFASTKYTYFCQFIWTSHRERMTVKHFMTNLYEWGLAGAQIWCTTNCANGLADPVYDVIQRWRQAKIPNFGTGNFIQLSFP